MWLGKVLRNAREVSSFNKPTTREWDAVQKWLSNVQPLKPAEQGFAKCKEDLVTLRSGREHAWLDGAVEWLIRELRCRPITVSSLHHSLTSSKVGSRLLHSGCFNQRYAQNAPTCTIDP